MRPQLTLLKASTFLNRKYLFHDDESMNFCHNRFMARSTTEQKGKLLIIDDENDILEILADLLEDCASVILQARNGEEAIELLKSHRIDAILSDEKMPKKSGIEVLRWLREHEYQTPFIIHTGFGQKEVLKEAQKWGVFAVIDKPWDERKLISTVEKALRSGVTL